MTKAKRKRRAGAVALLEWRRRMAIEDAERENADREMMMRYELMIAEMRAQADAPRIASGIPCVLVSAAMVSGNGAAGALS